MTATRTRLRLPAALTLLLLVLVSAGEGLGVRFCLHETSGHGASSPADPAEGDDHAHGHHGEGSAPGHGHSDPSDPSGHSAHEGSSHDPTDPCGTLCQFLCVLAAGAQPPALDAGVVLSAAPSHAVPTRSRPAFVAVPRPTSLPHFLPFSQAPPVHG